MLNSISDNIFRFKKDIVIIPLVFAVSVFLLLVLFQPFEYRSYNLAKVLGDSILSGGLVLITTFTSRGITSYLVKKHSISHRKYFVQTLLDVLLFLSLTFLINLISGGFENISYVKWFWLSIKYISIFEVFLIPLSFILDKKDIHLLSLKEELKFSLSKICLVSESGKEKLELFPQNLLMIKSSSNYLEVIYIKDDKVNFTLLRNTLTSIQDEIDGYTFLFRCHRSYLININQIEKIKGNARGYSIALKGVAYKIPVSRSKISSFKSILNIS